MLRISHRGVCVSDHEASKRFYCEGLGFEPLQDYGMQEGPDMEKTMQLPGVSVRADMLKHPSGPSLELLHFHTPKAEGPREKRSTLQYGLVHLSFNTDSIEKSAAKLKAAGGTVYEDTFAHYPENNAKMMYCTDPDGVRIELMELGLPFGFSHSGICVPDIERSMKYYETFGFKAAENHVLDAGYDWLAKINETPGIKLRAQMMRDAEGNTIELLKVFEPASFGPRERKPLNRFGLTHMAFWDDEAEATVQKCTERGGYFVEEAHVKTPYIELWHGADPDGVRIELMRSVGQ